MTYRHAVEHDDASEFVTLDLTTGKSIPNVIWADDDQGMYGVATIQNGEALVDSDGNVIISVFRGNIRLIDTRLVHGSNRTIN